MHEPYRIVLAGLATVGTGIVRIVQRNAACLAAQVVPQTRLLANRASPW